MKTKKVGLLILATAITVSFSQPVVAAVTQYNTAEYNQIIIKKGEKARLTMNGIKNVKLKSSNNKILKVGKKGKIQALKTGTVKVKITKGKKVKRCTIQVKKKVKAATSDTVTINSRYEDGSVKSTIQNNSDMVLRLCSTGTLSRNENGEWKAVGLKEPITGMGPFQCVTAGGKLEFSQRLVDVYDISVPGTYKIEFTGKSINNNKTIKVSGEFEIK